MKPRNLLFLFTDEQRADTMAAYGNTKIDTPNLNRLADKSVVFEKCYVTQPVCTPSRSSIMTGLYPHTNRCTQNNIPLPEDIPCLPEMVSGYRTGYFGKWHLGDEIFAQHGFEHWISIEDMYVPYFSARRDKNARSTYHHWLVGKGYTPDRVSDDNPGVFGRSLAARLPEPHCKPAYLARETSQWVRRQSPERPFMAYVNFLEPHMPFTGPRDGQYRSDYVDLPANFDHIPDGRNHLKARLLYERYRQGFGGVALDTEAGWRRLIANYWGLVSQVDAAVGAILDSLRECGLDETTIIVYTSDHGDMMGSHHLLAKTVMMEESVTVPCLIKVPGIRPRTESQIVSQIDLVPTLLDLLGAEIPDTLQGQSLRPLIETGQSPEQPDVFIEWIGPDSGVSEFERDAENLKPYAYLGSQDRLAAAVTDPVRTVVTADRWKLNFSPHIGEHELYNLNDDPYEMNNLYGLPQYQSLVKEMKQRLREWGRGCDDPVAAGI